MAEEVKELFSILVRFKVFK